MREIIVHSLYPITLIGGGEATPQDLYKALKLAPTCVAADSGAALAVSEGVPLSAVIGDFDSLDPLIVAGLSPSILHKIAEQDSTDFEKALERIQSPVVVGVGFTGARIDHQLAALHTLLRFAHQPCVLISPSEVIFLAPPQLELQMEEGDVVSVFPLVQTTGRSTGLRWPIDDLVFAPGKRIGTSNFADGPIYIEIDNPGMLMILPLTLIQQVVHQLGLSTSKRWPAHAAEHTDQQTL